MANLWDMMFGTGFKKMPTMTKQQQQLLNNMIDQMQGQGPLGQAYGQAMQNYQQFLDPSSEAFEQFAAPYKTQFEQEIIPGLAERFAGAGGAMGGGLSSSGFGQALSSAGAGLESNLAAMKGNLMNQAMQGIMNQ